ncbi:SDR family oxidoreductase [Methylocystis sp. IM3]|uniref:SDR family NAD(P)-dependent oxidoreductase n=2 Tax=Methylocystis TaxID=133 RepID=UPI0030FA6613
MISKKETPMSTPSDYYKDKVAVVTGAASGIGLALVETMLSYGAKKVIMADFNDENLNREAARLKLAYPDKVLGLHCNVTKEDDVRQMIHKAEEFGGRIDLLFNNAGAGLAGAFDQLTNDDWAKAFALNFYGALYGVRAVLPILRKQGGGHIVNIISGIAFYPMPEQTMYAATKAALNGMTLALRAELWDEAIRVTSATPGTTATAIFQGKAMPPTAQTPELSAQAILAGVAKNERLVIGDRLALGEKGDAVSARYGLNPDFSDMWDKILAEAARKRRAGEVAL